MTIHAIEDCTTADYLMGRVLKRIAKGDYSEANQTTLTGQLKDLAGYMERTGDMPSPVPEESV